MNKAHTKQAMHNIEPLKVRGAQFYYSFSLV